jgi:hypothetical protein
VRSAVGLSSKHHGKLHHQKPKNGTATKVNATKEDEDEDEGCADVPLISLTNITHNNLAGSGPDEGKEGIWFEGHVQELRRDVYVVINAHGKYVPQASWENGLSRNHEFASVNVRANSSVDLTFNVLDRKTKEAVYVPRLFLTFYDLDTDGNGSTAEYVAAKIESHRAMTAINTEIRRDLKKEDGTIVFWGTKYGTGTDNPADPRNLTNAQRKRTVTFFHTNVTEVNTTIGCTEGTMPRYFYFTLGPLTKCGGHRYHNKTLEEQAAVAEAVKAEVALAKAAAAASQQVSHHVVKRCCLGPFCTDAPQWWTAECHEEEA